MIGIPATFEECRHADCPADCERSCRPAGAHAGIAVQSGEPAWLHYRRHRHRQNGHAADHRAIAVEYRRAGLHGRYQGRPLRAGEAGHARREDGQAAGDAGRTGAAMGRLPGHVLGRLRRERTPGARHHFRSRPPAPGAHAEPERYPGRRAAAGVQDRRRQRHAAARHQGPARDAAARGRQCGRLQDQLRQRQRRQHRRHPARPAVN